MTIYGRIRKLTAVLLSAQLVWLGGIGAIAHAGVVSTQEAQQIEQVNYDRAQLIQLVNSEELGNKFVAMGIDPNVAEQRINHMTPEELNQLNDRLNELPAGGDALGTVAFVFLVLVFTDAIGVTDIFPFVNEIN